MGAHNGMQFPVGDLFHRFEDIPGHQRVPGFNNINAYLVQQIGDGHLDMAVKINAGRLFALP